MNSRLKFPNVSVIIPFKDFNNIVEKCIIECLKQDYPNYDIYLVPDNPLDKKFRKTKIIPTGNVYPSEKRNIAINKSSCDICAFIDSDAFPVSNQWIKNAVRFFEDISVGAVGGPNIVPKNAGFLEQASADVIYSRLCAGGNYPIRNYKIKGSYEYREIASSNLFVKRAILRRLGGFDIYQLTSEDSKLCFQITNLGMKVIFSPNVAVYHRRRRLILPHTKRMFVEGRNKAFVFKDIPTMKNFFYFFPSIWVLFLSIGLVLSQISTIIKIIYFGIILLYLLLVLIEGFRRNPINRGIIVAIGIMLTHIFYGIGFIIGLFTDKHKLRTKLLANKYI